ncbi:MAG: glycosyltransferase family 9 protein [Oligoflexia bacterium]|nr:glycosyltransferase family 9 protein [Oligoflexia bacterium]
MTAKSGVVKSILVIKLGGWADTVLSSFVAPALKEKYPEAKITLLLGKSLSDWASSLHYDDVILVNDKLFYSKSPLQQAAESASLVFKIKQRNFDLGISLHNSWHFAVLMKAAGVKHTVGLIREDAVTPKDSLARHLPSMLNPLFSLVPKELTEKFHAFDKPVLLRKNVSEMDRYLDVLAAIDVKPEKLNFKLKVRQGVHDEVMLRLAGEGLRSKGYLVVSPGGGENAQRKFYHKRWTYFSEFLRLFCQKTGLPILLLGGETDRDLVPPLMHIEPGRIFSWVGSTTREEALSIIGEAYAFVGCDSGLSHVAGAVGVPSVVIHGPTSSKTNHPPGLGKTVICLDAQIPCSPCYKDDGNFNWSCSDNVCVKSISPQHVWQALAQIAKFPA